MLETLSFNHLLQSGSPLGSILPTPSVYGVNTCIKDDYFFVLAGIENVRMFVIVH